MVGKALRAEGAAECIQKSRRTQIVGGANTPTFGYGRGGSDSTTDQKRKVPSGFGSSSQSRRFQGNQGRGNCHSGPENYECKGQGCFQCRVTEHYKRDCPQLKKEEQKTEAKPAPARVFALNQTDAEASPSVVTGQLSVNNFYYSILFDSGATHSYVAVRIIGKFG
ncbi:hypothetical protein CsatB_001834 [Cannabis sativa]